MIQAYDHNIDYIRHLTISVLWTELWDIEFAEPEIPFRSIIIA